jgi:hypothetical protein
MIISHWHGGNPAAVAVAGPPSAAAVTAAFRGGRVVRSNQGRSVASLQHLNVPPLWAAMAASMTGNDTKFGYSSCARVRVGDNTDLLSVPVMLAVGAARSYYQSVLRHQRRA